ncbi:MAG: hypothetical protein RQ875_14360 [Vicingaceae bacterium]|nr:hypothetical protein [Vicingaceae bacterium]
MTAKKYSIAHGILDVFEDTQLNEIYIKMVSLGIEHSLYPVENSYPNVIQTYFDRLSDNRKKQTLSYFLISDIEVKLNIYEADFKILVHHEYHRPNEKHFFYQELFKERKHLYNLVKKYSKEFNKSEFIEKIKEKGITHNKFYFIIFLRHEQIDEVLYRLMVEIEFLRQLIEENRKFILELDITPDEKYKKLIWFKLGLLFATGKMNEYLNPNNTTLKDNYSPSKIAKELGNESFEKYILATINNYSLNNSNANKNIFNSRDKMLKIINHCEINNLAIDPYFKECLPTE